MTVVKRNAEPNLISFEEGPRMFSLRGTNTVRQSATTESRSRASLQLPAKSMRDGQHRAKGSPATNPNAAPGDAGGMTATLGTTDTSSADQAATFVQV